LFPSRLESCTLVGNSGGSEDGIAGIEFLEGGSVHASILVGNGPGRTCSGIVEWSCCDLFGNTGGNAPCGTDAGGNFSADPAVLQRQSGRLVMWRCARARLALRMPAPRSVGWWAPAPIECISEAVQPLSWSALKSLYRGPQTIR
jgi:hypothetical protein